MVKDSRIKAADSVFFVCGGCQKIPDQVGGDGLLMGWLKDSRVKPKDTA